MVWQMQKEKQNRMLYYFKKHKITAKSGKGFLSSDIKSIKLLRK